MKPFPIDAVRKEFPSLSIADDGQPRIYADNPAGTQVPQRVAQAASRCLIESNANLGGYFRTSVLAGAQVDLAHRAMVTMLGAASAAEVIIAQSMTNLTFHVSRSIANMLAPGDEVVVTRMDHDGNVAPWLMMAQDRGLTVRWVDFDKDTWTILPEALDAVLTPRTRLVALNYASNLTGSINDIAALIERVHAAGALAYIDAVQLAPHEFIDVKALGCDFLACSSYKFFGPHLGILWGREALLEDLVAYKVRPATNDLPSRFELGTPQIELQAALAAAVGYFVWLGEACGGSGTPRELIQYAFAAATAYERTLASALIEGLKRFPGVTVHGIVDPARYGSRVPTVSFTHDSKSTDSIARALAAKNIFVWSGNNYALEVVRSLGLDENSGVVRIGLAHYNTAREVQEILKAVEAAIS
ncbi:MAG: cysteine desulfurase-like protein [Candidatus Eremiobacteraeota bacterium]|nr:cysteine desulfurase-like protein [Candidatus Eremiobacteraeota bacterium]